MNQHIFQVYPCAEISKPFLKCSFEGHMDEIIEKAHGGVGLRHITKQELEKIELLVPPMDVQDAFVTFAQQSDKSKLLHSKTICLIRALETRYEHAISNHSK